MEHVIESFGPLKEHLVFISEGATWIKNWIEDSYSEATYLLDFYHAGQYLYELANTVYWQDEKKVNKWVTKQKELLLRSKLPVVMEPIRQLSSSTAAQAAKKILKYYGENKKRMDYKKYLNMGAKIIGSGAIESAHRTVVQKRTNCRGSDELNKECKILCSILRVTEMNDRWGQNYPTDGNSNREGCLERKI